VTIVEGARKGRSFATVRIACVAGSIHDAGASFGDAVFVFEERVDTKVAATRKGTVADGAALDKLDAVRITNIGGSILGALLIPPIIMGAALVDLDAAGRKYCRKSD
jgi:hypothetical protein